MLATLSATRTPLIRRGAPSTRPVVTVRWIKAPPHRVSGATRVLLAEGIWIVPSRARSTAVLRRPEWMTQGLCTALPTKAADALFFGMERREAPGMLIDAANAARQLCARCPVLTVCLTHALITGERYGVWGGTSGRQRSKLRVQMEAGAGIDELVATCVPVPDG